MFVDLVNSMGLSDTLDDETVIGLINVYRDTCARAVRAVDGFVARYIGDGLLAYFGYPQAHEDDAIRAVTAGLDLLQRMAACNERLQKLGQPALRVRVGIHTGMVVVGDMAGDETLERMAVMGKTPNMAARIQSAANPDRVLLSIDTARLLHDRFELRSLGPRRLKGLEQPVELLEAVGPAKADAGRSPRGKQTYFVGRRRELALLSDAWRRAVAGEGKTFLITGDPGIGKSRFTLEFQNALAGMPHQLICWHCSALTAGSDHAPIVQYLRERFCLSDQDNEAARRRQVREALVLLGLETSSLLFELLLGFDAPESPSELTGLTPERIRELTTAAILRWLFEEARRQPLLLVVEDLHWADASTLGFLAQLARSNMFAPMMLLLTTRPEFSALPGLEVERIQLARLDHSAVAELLSRLLGGLEPPPELRTAVVAKTDGVPLFVEEITKLLIESGAIALHPDRVEVTRSMDETLIPASLRDLLMARLDRVQEAKEIAQAASVIGRIFSRTLLSQLTGRTERELQRPLRALLELDILREQGTSPLAAYSFKHALIQDVAYGSLLRRDRRRLHRDVAEALAAETSDSVVGRPERLAHHYSNAAMPQEAATWWLRAGQRAQQRSATREAVGHLRSGIEALAELADTPARDSLELQIQLALGASLIATDGWAAAGVEQAYLRARALCTESENDRALFDVLRGLLNVYLLRADLGSASDIARRLYEMAEAAGEPALFLEAHRGLGVCSFLAGSLAELVARMGQSLAIYEREQHHRHAFIYGADPAVVALSWQGWALLLLGERGRGYAVCERAVALAETLSHPFSQGYALCFAASLRQADGKPAEALACADAAIAIANRAGYPYWRAWGSMVRGWALARLGEGSEGVRQVENGLQEYGATGASMMRGYGLALLADAQRCSGAPAGAITPISEAIAHIEITGIGFYGPEIFAWKGDLLRELGVDPMGAARCHAESRRLAGRRGTLPPAELPPTMVVISTQ